MNKKTLLFLMLFSLVNCHTVSKKQLDKEAEAKRIEEERKTASLQNIKTFLFKVIEKENDKALVHLKEPTPDVYYLKIKGFSNKQVFFIKKKEKKQGIMKLNGIKLKVGKYYRAVVI